METPRLVEIKTYVRDIAATQAFWAEHFGLEPDPASAETYSIGDVTWRLLPGAQPCGTRGPHGALPAFQISDFGAARGYLKAHDIPIVFEEMLPGLNLLIFLDPDATPIQISQATDPRAWDIADRKELRTRRRRDEASAGPLRLGPLDELSMYSHDITAGGRFYRDTLGFPVGLSFFGHIHLVAGDLPLVLRGTNWRCKTPDLLHATQPVFAVPDLDAWADRLRAAGYAPKFASSRTLQVTDPAGLRLDLIAA